MCVYTGVHTILDIFSCQHEKLAVIVSTQPKNILPVSHITCSCKAEYLDTLINYTILSIFISYYCYYGKANYFLMKHQPLAR